jgi:hypothetical protein
MPVYRVTTDAISTTLQSARENALRLRACCLYLHTLPPGHTIGVAGFTIPGSERAQTASRKLAQEQLTELLRAHPLDPPDIESAIMTLSSAAAMEPAELIKKLLENFMLLYTESYWNGAHAQYQLMSDARTRAHAHYVEMFEDVDNIMSMIVVNAPPAQLHLYPIPALKHVFEPVANDMIVRLHSFAASLFGNTHWYSESKVENMPAAQGAVDSDELTAIGAKLPEDLSRALVGDLEDLEYKYIIDERARTAWQLEEVPKIIKPVISRGVGFTEYVITERAWWNALPARYIAVVVLVLLAVFAIYYFVFAEKKNNSQ